MHNNGCTVFQRLINKESDMLHYKDRGGNTLLHIVAKNKNEEFLKCIKVKIIPYHLYKYF